MVTYNNYSRTILSIHVDWIRKFIKYLNFFLASEGILAEHVKVILTRRIFCSLDRLELIIGLEISDLKAILTILWRLHKN